MRFDASRHHANHHADRDAIAPFSPAAERLRRGFAGAGRPRMRHASLALLEAVLRLAGPKAQLLAHAERPWASATFSGTRHGITLAFEEAEAIETGEAFIAALPEHEFHITRQLVADASIAEVMHSHHPDLRMVVEAELLLLEDC